MKSLKVRFGHLIILHIRLVSTTTGQHHTFGPSVGFSVSDEIHVVCLDEHQGIASRPVPMLSKVLRHPLALLL